MKETETPDQWYRRKYPKENHQGLYDSNFGGPPLWPEWTIAEYAKYFVKSSLPSEQEIDKIIGKKFKSNAFTLRSIYELGFKDALELLTKGVKQ